MFTFTYGLNCPHCGADLTEPDAIVAALSTGRNPAAGITGYVDEYGYIAESYSQVDGCAPTQLCLDDPATIFSCRKCLNRLDVTPVEEV